MDILVCDQCHQSLPESTLICPHCQHSMADQRHQSYANEVMSSNRGESGAWRLLMVLYSLGLFVSVGFLFTGYWHIAGLILVAVIVVSLL